MLCAIIYCTSIFDTREPETPVTNQSSWIQPTSPNSVMINLRNAIAEKNITNYLRCLADTSLSEKFFIFIPEPAVANANPGLFDRWSKDKEEAYFYQMLLFLPTDSTSKLSLELLREDAPGDSVILLHKYELTIHQKCQDENSSCPRSMEGQVEFRLVRTDEDFWYIYQWKDFSISNTPAWSDLKSPVWKIII